MKKYCYFVTNENHWFDIAKKLYEEKIAEPVLWIGDDNLFSKASSLFGKNVVRMLDVVHRPYQFQGIEYNGEFQEFLFSKNYLRAKDICLKMMDRLDLYGTFSRIDREAYLHNLTLWILKRFSVSKPDVLIATEAPHDHARYLIYEVCRFLEIPCYVFRTWMLGPMLYLQNMETREIISVKKSDLNEIDRVIEENIKNFINGIKYRPKDYELSYMKTNKKNNKSFNRVINFFKGEKSKVSKDYISVLKEIMHNSKNLFYRKYNPINPFFFNFISRTLYSTIRRKNLNNASKISETEISKEENYIYFPLHYEPERSTNPDGGDFHDQFIAISELRKILPSNYKIIVKEHPSQLFSYNPRGARGRSPLFYNLIKNISGVRIAKTSSNSFDLIKGSKFVSTITGSVAIEAAILGKPVLTFGLTYFDGCPNIINWESGITFERIINTKLLSDKEIEEFLISKKRETSLIGFQNYSQRNVFKEYDTEQFNKIQTKQLLGLLSDFFINQKF